MHLQKHLRPLLIPDLTGGRITTYMADRKAESASNRTINLALGVLSRAIGYPFRMLWPKLKRLEERHERGRAWALNLATALELMTVVMTLAGLVWAPPP